MAVTNKYPNTETSVYSYLVSVMGLNIAAACGVLANIQNESNFNHQAIGDNGTSYGLCQWHNTRWDNLKSYCANNRLNSTTVNGQMSYLNYELNSAYYKHVIDKLKSVPNTSQGAYDAAWYWCYHFEVPASKETKSKERGSLAGGTYWRYYSNNNTVVTPIDPANSKGLKIVTKAREILASGKTYVPNTAGPESFDQSGFVYYVYKEAINYDWDRKSSYHMYRDYGRIVSDMRSGDLVFFRDTGISATSSNNPNITHVGIATGDGDEIIHCDPLEGKVSSMKLYENDYYKSRYYGTKRILADSETVSYSANIVEEVSSSNTFVETNAAGTVNIFMQNIYNSEYSELIGELTEISNVSDNTGYNNYGVLADTVHGGEFKFYVPEYDISTQPSWDDVSIIGRSATIKGYNSTASRSVDINVMLVAGVGLYAKSTTGDRVADMHRDIAFVESLAYPDYSGAYVLPPPIVTLYLGPTLNMRGVVSNVSVSYKKPYDIEMRPMIAELSFTVTHVTDNPPDYYDVRNQRLDGSRSGSLNMNALKPRIVSNGSSAADLAIYRTQTGG